MSICKFDFHPLMQSSSGLISVQSLVPLPDINQSDNRGNLARNSSREEHKQEKKLIITIVVVTATKEFRVKIPNFREWRRSLHRIVLHGHPMYEIDMSLVETVYVRWNDISFEQIILNSAETRYLSSILSEEDRTSIPM